MTKTKQPKVPLWEMEFGKDAAIPNEITALITRGKLIDTSWHNDVCPSFETVGEGLGFRLWVQHPEVELREMAEQVSERFMVSVVDEDVSLKDALKTDDIKEVEEFLLHSLAYKHNGGLLIVNRKTTLSDVKVGEPKFFDSFWKGERRRMCRGHVICSSTLVHSDKSTTDRTTIYAYDPTQKTTRVVSQSCVDAEEARAFVAAIWKREIKDTSTEGRNWLRRSRVLSTMR